MTTSGRPRIVVLGGINLNMVAVTARAPAAGQTVVGTRFLSYHGGKGANQAVAAARMGADVALVGRVGDDAFGRELLAGLAERGVDTKRVAVAEAVSSGVSLITVETGGQNRIIQVPGANHTCGPAEVERARALLPGASMLLLTLELPLQVVAAAAEAATAAGVPVMLDPGPAKPIPAELYRFCSVITPNETEAATLVEFPVDDDASVVRAARELQRRGAASVVVKLGGRGAYVAIADSGEFVPAFAVASVDSVAAGDAFNGALAVALAEGWPLHEAVRVASAAGALAVTRHGAQDAMPQRSEVEALLTEGK
ncbi:MAG: ribokinase [Dehalococcoidia bacterium]|nr:ribokinase [Dehalococcoidia bacterium]